MSPEDSTSDDDADPDDEWKSSLHDLADRIRNEKSTARTAESTPASDWAPKITAAERPDTDSATDGTAGFEFGHTSSADDDNERPEVADSGDTDETGEPPRDESTDPETDSIRNDEHTDTDRPVSQSEESSAETSESAVEALGDVKTAASAASDGDETTTTDTTIDTDDRDADTDSADRSAAGDDTDVDAEISAEETNFGDAFKTDSHADSSDLGTDTDTQQPEDEEPSLGNIGAADETEATTAPSADTQSDSDSAVGATSEHAETETPARTGVGSNTFGELADRMAASRENNASAERNEPDSSKPDDGSSDDTPARSDESSRQLPLGANEPEFSTDLAPLVQPNMSAMLLGALKSAPVDQACGKLLAFPDGRDYNLLLVTVTQSAEDRLLTVYENSEGLPENIGVVAIDNNVSAQNTTQTIPVGGVDRTVHMKTATDPGDIKGIGIRISKQLSEWDNNDRPTMVCFHSLTSILQYISTKQLFQFIHLLQNRLRSYDAVVHYHIDPSVHDKMTLSQIKPLLDHVIEVENDGTCWIE